MIANATAKVRIEPVPEIARTIKWYARCLQICIDVGHRKSIKNNIKLHPFVYKRIRKHLPSQLAISCIKQACAILKKAKTKPIIKRASPRFNFPRNAHLKGDVLVLRLLKKRYEFKLNIPDCYKEYFGWDIRESLLKVDKKGRCFFMFCFQNEVTQRNGKHTLGIDLGIKNIAVTSNNKFYNSKSVKRAKRRFKHLRSKLQAKGTRSAKRLLKKISRRETRFMTWINHNISKQIVTDFNGDKIIMEDLTGIKKRRRSKTMNWLLHNWSYFQLSNFIKYKAERLGISFEKVSPNYTSQICHICGKLGVRCHSNFSCNHCGLTNFNADLNASRNLAHPKLVVRQASVNMPYIACDEHKGSVANNCV